MTAVMSRPHLLLHTIARRARLSRSGMRARRGTLPGVDRAGMDARRANRVGDPIEESGQGRLPSGTPGAGRKGFMEGFPPQPDARFDYLHIPAIGVRRAKGRRSRPEFAKEASF